MKNQHETFYLIFNRKKMKYPPFIPDKCLADHKSGLKPLYRSAKHLWLSALFIAQRNKNSLIFSHKTSSVFLEKRFGLQNQTEVPSNRKGTSSPLLAIHTFKNSAAEHNSSFCLYIIKIYNTIKL